MSLIKRLTEPRESKKAVWGCPHCSKNFFTEEACEAHIERAHG